MLAFVSFSDGFYWRRVVAGHWFRWPRGAGGTAIALPAPLAGEVLEDNPQTTTERAGHI